LTLGVLGSMVWDRIDHPDAPRVERWGGIAYSLAAAAAAAPDEWSLRPIIRLGDDLADEAHAFFARLPLEPGGVIEVPEPNNRVHLHYLDRQHRHEHLTGGVGPWPWDQLEPLIDGLDGLYVNLISGFELELDTARRLRDAFDGPIYADLHSLLLGVAAGGHRVPRTLARRGAWLACFDVVQVNEPELALVAGDDDPWEVAEAAVHDGVAALLVTRGPEGATWMAAGDRAWPWADRDPDAAVRRGDVPVQEPWSEGDPTGCGDVWGATCCVALLQGETVSEAAAVANDAASRNVKHRGADGLYRYLRGNP
jgi:sugar/nucleoside kinase (ribokinase family)